MCRFVRNVKAVQTRSKGTNVLFALRLGSDVSPELTACATNRFYRVRRWYTFNVTTQAKAFRTFAASAIPPIHFLRTLCTPIYRWGGRRRLDTGGCACSGTGVQEAQIAEALPSATKSDFSSAQVMNPLSPIKFMVVP